MALASFLLSFNWKLLTHQDTVAKLRLRLGHETLVHDIRQTLVLELWVVAWVIQIDPGVSSRIGSLLGVK